MDSCFALIRAHQHCIAKHYGDTRSFHSTLYFQGGPTDVGLVKPRPPPFGCDACKTQFSGKQKVLHDIYHIAQGLVVVCAINSSV